MFRFFVETYIKVFFLLGPFFALSLFLKMADGMEAKERRHAAIRASKTVLVAVTVFFFFGKALFGLLGITLAAFQIGTGTTLFLTAVMLVLNISRHPSPSPDEDFAIVPLALPVIVGPGTIGTLMVWSTELPHGRQRLTAYAAILTAALTMSLFLIAAEWIEKRLGHKVLAMMTKLTALVLTALAAQIVFTGIKNFMAA